VRACVLVLCAALVISFGVTMAHAIECPPSWQPGCTVNIDMKCTKSGCTELVGPECAGAADKCKSDENGNGCGTTCTGTSTCCQVCVTSDWNPELQQCVGRTPVVTGDCCSG
jgi:hypothetical protein